MCTQPSTHIPFPLHTMRARRICIVSLFLLSVPLVAFRSATHAASSPHSCDPSNPSTKSLAFCDKRLPISRRVDDLVSRLTLAEKILQLGDEAPAIPRLGIPEYKWWSESLHGVSNSGKGIRFNGMLRSATSFPQVILTAATFDRSLWYRIGKAIGIEARAYYNAGQASGLTFWSPNINLFRDPRWGRGQETPGEDPTVTGKYAVSYVRGLQGERYKGGGLTKLVASACCKHFTAYDLDRWKGTSRFNYNAKVSKQDLADSYNPPFERCVEDGHASGMMCSYNQVNGVPTCADYNLLTRTARGAWGFYGYITSDCGAVSIIHDAQGYAKTPEDAVGDVLKAGLDVNCGSYLQKHTGSALQQRKVSQSDVNRALRNLFTIRMRLGLFDGDPKHQAYGSIGPSQVCTKEHRDLALEAARNGIVLLKNSRGLLPLSRSRVSSLAVIGPNANNAWKLLGNYAGPPCKQVTALHALGFYVRNTRYVAGCDSAGCSSASIGEAVKLASSVDYVVMFMGLDDTQEREGLDRENLVLPGMQQELITGVAKAARRPVILVLICGGPVDVSFAKHDAKVGAILWGGYPGQEGGLALAQVIFGDHNPGGKLPMTWYPQDYTKVPMTDMSMRPNPATGNPGRTYRFYKGKTVYPYGYGLSYSSYSYRFASVTASQLYLNKTTTLGSSLKSGNASYRVSEMGVGGCESSKFSAVVKVHNRGEMAGRHPVLLFLERSDSRGGRPLKQLIGFETAHLKAGERTRIEFVVNPCEHLSRVEVDGSKVMDGGSHILVVGRKKYQIDVLF